MASVAGSFNILSALLLILATAPVVAESEQVPDPAAMADQCEALEHGEPSRAIEVAEQIVALNGEIDPVLYLRALGCKAWALVALGRRLEASQLTDQLAPIYRDFDDISDQLRGLKREASLRHWLGDLEQSIQLLGEALELTEAGNYPGERIDFLTNLGSYHAEAENHDLAIEHFNEALAMVEQVGDPRQALPIRYNLGLVYRGAGQLEEAAAVFQELLEPLQVPGMEIRLASLHSVLGSIYRELEDYVEAARHLEASSRLHETLDNPAEHAALLIDQAYLNLAIGEPETALHFSEQALSEARRANYHFSLIGALSAHAATLEATGHYQEALGIVRERASMVQDYMNEQQRTQLNQLEADLGLAVRERELAELRTSSEARAREFELRQQRQYMVVMGLVALLLVGISMLLVQRANNRRLGVWSRTDALTGLANRRQISEWLAEMPESTLVLMLDLDHFKEINDAWGHSFGDRVLKEVGECLDEFARTRGGKVGRWGGEEFLLILHGSDEEQARSLGDQVCQAIAGLRIQTREGNNLQLTASVGIAPFAAAAPDGAVKNWESALLLADELMYRAKRAGRNRCITVWPEGDRKLTVADLKS